MALRRSAATAHIVLVNTEEVPAHITAAWLNGFDLYDLDGQVCHQCCHEKRDAPSLIAVYQVSWLYNSRHAQRVYPRFTRRLLRDFLFQFSRLVI